MTRWWTRDIGSRYTYFKTHKYSLFIDLNLFNYIFFIINFIVFAYIRHNNSNQCLHLLLKKKTLSHVRANS